METSRSRRRTAAQLSALLLTGLCALVDEAGALEDPALRTRQTTLDNGLTVLTLEDHSTPVVSFQMWVRVGSRDETRYTGLAHLFEHMMFKGSENVAPELHARLIQERGGSVNAYTSNDVTVYFEDVTSETLPLVIDLEAERLANLDISEETLASEREVVLEERRMRTEDQPEGLGFESLLGITFLAHPYRVPVIGWRSDVEAVPLAACRSFFHTYYAPNNIVIVIVGDFDGEVTLERIRRRFGRLEPAEIPRTPTREPAQLGERRAEVEFDVRTPLLMAAWHAPKTGHPDAEPLDVASAILSSGRSSRLYRKLVYEEEQALHAQGGYWELADAGVFYATASVRPGSTHERVEELFFAEIARLRDEPVSAEELEKAKRTLEVSLLDDLDTAHELAGRIAGDFVFQGRIRPLDERLEAIRAVGAPDVQRVARSYLVDDKRSVVRVTASAPE
jgi:zinc protease